MVSKLPTIESSSLVVILAALGSIIRNSYSICTLGCIYMQKFDNRKCVVLKRYWDQLTVDYMTEESDDDPDCGA